MCSQSVLYVEPHLHTITSEINSHLRWFLHDAVARPEENIDGTLVVWSVIGSSNSEICELNIVSTFSPRLVLVSSLCRSCRGLVRLFTSIEIRASGCESRVLLVIYPT